MPKSKFVPQVSLRLVREGGVRYDASISSPEAAAAAVACQLIGDREREHMVVLLLDRKHRLAAVEIVGIGTTASVLVDASTTFRSALLSGASALIMAHCHPSGVLTPSGDDLALTRTMIEAGKLLGIKVLDHLIVAAGQHLSLREMHPGFGWEG